MNMAPYGSTVPYLELLRLQHGFHLLVNILSCEAQLLVQHLVWGGETERGQAPNLAVGTYQAFQRDGQSGGQAEYLGTAGQDAFLIVDTSEPEANIMMSGFSSEPATMYAPLAAWL